CREFGEDESEGRKRVIIVFFTSEDPALSAHLDSLKLSLRSARARLFAIAIQRVAPPEFPARPDTRSYPYPAMTAQVLSRIAADTGGKLFQRGWNLKDILRETRKP